MQDFLDFFFFLICLMPEETLFPQTSPSGPSRKFNVEAWTLAKGTCRCVTLCYMRIAYFQQEQGALVRPVEMATSIGMSVPPAAWVCLSKAWGTAGHTGLSSEPGMRGQGWHHAGLCTAVPLSGAKPTLPFPPQPPKPV